MIDITQEIFSGAVYPGDTAPSFRRVSSLESGDACTLTDFSMCAHNGTHLDAPSHFVRGGQAADAIDLSRCVGRCTVYAEGGEIRADDLAKVSSERILFRGSLMISEDVARALALRFRLVGVEAQSVGDARIHKILLEAGVAVLEGLDLHAAPTGDYILLALPMKLGGADGAPVRAVLLNAEEGECLL